MVWLLGDLSSTQRKRSGRSTWSLMSSNAIVWACGWVSLKSRQSMVASGIGMNTLAEF